MKKIRSYLFILSLVCLAYSCNREEGFVKPNQAPDTKISVDSINLSGDNRLNSLVDLNWYGSDPDGFVIGYEISFDLVSWEFTTSQDSTFKFSIASGSDTADINFYIRSIDQNLVRDPSPAYLKIPIKNTAPTVKLSEDLNLPDTAFLAATTAWSASDIDGTETITQVLLSLNGQDWFELNKSKKTFTLVPSDPLASDTTQARIYYESDQNPASQPIPGLILNDTNRIYLKAIDQAGTESKVDTSDVFYMKGKKNDVLMVGGIGGNARNIYQTTLSNISVTYDYLDLLANSGLYQPKIWNVTFRLQLSFYSKLFFFSDETIFTNSYTNLSGLLLEFAAASLQQYANSGGKYFIATSFDHNQNIDGFVGVLPIESVSTKNYGDARLYQDSAIVSTLAGFPDLNPTSFALSGVGVYNVDLQDTEVLYTANVVDRRPTSPWPDTKIIGSGRRVSGKLNQVYFGMQLWELYQDPLKLEALFNQIFNIEFN